MTAILSWITQDGHGFASFYLASDSRRSILHASTRKMSPGGDDMRKTFASSETPDVFAICGTVTHAKVFLGSLLAVLPEVRSQHSEAVAAPKDYTQQLFDTAVAKQRPEDGLIVFHGYRFGAYGFGLSKVQMCKDNGSVAASVTTVVLGARAGILWRDGSGEDMVERVQTHDSERDARGFSRWIWQTFCDALSDSTDPRSGGAPQIVGLYRRGNGQILGVRFRGHSYVDGKPCTEEGKYDFEFRDELFQRVDQTGQLLRNAQRHARNPTPPVREVLVT